MKHEMNLLNKPFEQMKSGQKTIELRLNDEKRRLIHIGDRIVFNNRQTKEQLCVQVANVKVFNNFKELYQAYSKTRMGYTLKELANPNDMLTIYTQEQIDKYGVLAIELFQLKSK